MATGSFVQVTSGVGPKLGTGPLYTENSNVVQDEKVILGEQYLASYLATPAFTAGAVTTGTASSHLFQIMSGASLKVRIRRIEIHQVAAATAAVNQQFLLYRLSTAGTGGTVATPAPLDPADAASGATAMALPTVKGTEGTGILTAYGYLIQTIGASTIMPEPIVVWDFDRPRSKPLIIAAGAANGIAIKNGAAAAGATVQINVWLDEMAF
jgi:hypothetical protein